MRETGQVRRPTADSGPARPGATPIISARAPGTRKLTVSGAVAAGTVMVSSPAVLFAAQMASRRLVTPSGPVGKRW